MGIGVEIYNLVVEILGPLPMDSNNKFLFLKNNSWNFTSASVNVLFDSFKQEFSFLSVKRNKVESVVLNLTDGI